MRAFDPVAVRRVARFGEVAEVSPIVDGPEVLRRAAHYLGQLAERNPLIVQTSSWGLAAEGLARLVRDLEDLRNVIAVDFGRESFDPNQLNFSFEGLEGKQRRFA